MKGLKLYFSMGPLGVHKKFGLGTIDNILPMYSVIKYFSCLFLPVLFKTLFTLKNARSRRSGYRVSTPLQSWKITSSSIALGLNYSEHREGSL